MPRNARWGGIERRASGRYRATYKHPYDPRPTARVRAPRTFRTKEAAESWLARERALIESGTWTHPDERDRARAAAEAAATRAATTFGDYAPAWLAARQLTFETRRTYDSYLRIHLLPAWQDMPLTEITTPLVRSWVAHDLAPDHPPVRQKAYAVFSTIMATAVDDELIPATPCKRSMAPRKPDPLAEVEPLTVAELQALADHVTPQAAALILTMGLCALRSGEARELRRKDLDLDAGVLHVRRAVTGQGRNLRIGSPKTRGSVRPITVPPALADRLRTHLAEYCETGPDALVFPAVGDPSRHMPSPSLNTVIDRGCRAAGLPSVTSHALRHTGLTLAAQAGATLADLKARAGHTTAAMVMRYQHSTRDRQRMIADRLSEALEPAAPTPPEGGQVIDLAAVRRRRAR